MNIKIIHTIYGICPSEGEKMKQMREMNKTIFYNNLMMTIYEIVDEKNIDEKSIRIKIIPVYEKDKSFTGMDDLMRLVFLSKENIGNRLLTVEETVNLVACKSPFVPLWINISLNGRDGNIFIFNFETSLRFRKPSLLRNTETGHAPFMAII